MTSDYDDISRLEQTSRAELITDIGEDTRKLISALEITRDPDAHISRMQFDLTTRHVAIPPSLAETIDATSEFDHLSVDFEHSKDTNATSLALIFSIERIDGTPISLLIHQIDGKFVTQILIGEDSGDPIETLVQPSEEDIARFLASLFAPSKTGDYGAFAGMNLKDPQVLARLEDVLAKHADDTISSGVFLIDASNGAQHQIEYSKENDTLKTATLEHANGKTVSVMTLAFDSDDGDGDYDVASLEGVRVYSRDKDGTSNQQECSTERIIFFDDFTKDLKQLLASGEEIASSRLDTVDPNPETNFTDGNGRNLRSDTDFSE